MNLSSIYKCFDSKDRDIIVHSMNYLWSTSIRGVKIKHNKTITPNLVWALDAFTVRRALCNELNDWQQLFAEDDRDKELANKLNRLIKLCDSILPRPRRAR